MTLILPTVTDPEVQEAMDRIGLYFPLGTEQLQDGAVGTNQIATEAALKPRVITGTTSDPTTTDTSNPPTVVLDEMAITADFGGNPILILFTGSFTNTAGNITRVRLHDSTAAADIEVNRSMDAAVGVLSQVFLYTPAAGSRTIEVRWSTSAGTATASGTNRTLVILELRR